MPTMPAPQTFAAQFKRLMRTSTHPEPKGGLADEYYGIFFPSEDDTSNPEILARRERFETASPIPLYDDQGARVDTVVESHMERWLEASLTQSRDFIQQRCPATALQHSPAATAAAFGGKDLATFLDSIPLDLDNPDASAEAVAHALVAIEHATGLAKVGNRSRTQLRDAALSYIATRAAKMHLEEKQFQYRDAEGQFQNNTKEAKAAAEKFTGSEESPGFISQLYEATNAKLGEWAAQNPGATPTHVKSFGLEKGAEDYTNELVAAATHAGDLADDKRELDREAAQIQARCEDAQNPDGHMGIGNAFKVEQDKTKALLDDVTQRITNAKDVALAECGGKKDSKRYKAFLWQAEKRELQAERDILVAQKQFLVKSKADNADRYDDDIKALDKKIAEHNCADDSPTKKYHLKKKELADLVEDAAQDPRAEDDPDVVARQQKIDQLRQELEAPESSFNSLSDDKQAWLERQGNIINPLVAQQVQLQDKHDRLADALAKKPGQAQQAMKHRKRLDRVHSARNPEYAVVVHGSGQDPSLDALRAQTNPEPKLDLLQQARSMLPLGLVKRFGSFNNSYIGPRTAIEIVLSSAPNGLPSLNAADYPEALQADWEKHGRPAVIDTIESLVKAAQADYNELAGIYNIISASPELEDLYQDQVREKLSSLTANLDKLSDILSDKTNAKLVNTHPDMDKFKKAAQEMFDACLLGHKAVHSRRADNAFSKRLGKAEDAEQLTEQANTQMSATYLVCVSGTPGHPNAKWATQGLVDESGNALDLRLADFEDAMNWLNNPYEMLKEVCETETDAKGNVNIKTDEHGKPVIKEEHKDKANIVAFAWQHKDDPTPKIKMTKKWSDKGYSIQCGTPKGLQNYQDALKAIHKDNVAKESKDESVAIGAEHEAHTDEDAAAAKKPDADATVGARHITAPGATGP